MSERNLLSTGRENARMQFHTLSERSAVVEIAPNLKLRVVIERGRAIAQFLEDGRTHGTVAISVPFVPTEPDPARTRRIAPPVFARPGGGR